MSQEVREKIQSQIDNHPVLLYMKGSPQFPRCGFSARAASILESEGISFQHVDILEEPAIREILPQMANWPTFPQLYIQGELIGGCDIMVELQGSGELSQLLSFAK